MVKAPKELPDYLTAPVEEAPRPLSPPLNLSGELPEHPPGASSATADRPRADRPASPPARKANGPDDPVAAKQREFFQRMAAINADDGE
jgi:hypothetical protein